MKNNTLAWWMWDFVQYFLNLSFQYIFIGFQDPMTVYSRNFNWGKIGAHGEKTIAIKKKNFEWQIQNVSGFLQHLLKIA